MNGVCDLCVGVVCENDCTQDLCVDGWCAHDPLGDGMPCDDGIGFCDAGTCLYDF